jgi:hypothetical protein
VQPRKHYRYQLGAPVMFFWKDARDTQHEGIGLTRDICVRGLFAFTASPPPLESEVKLKVFLPPGRSAVPPLRIQGRGRVVRVDAAPGGQRRAGFAVAGERFVLRRGGNIDEQESHTSDTEHGAVG